MKNKKAFIFFTIFLVKLILCWFLIYLAQCDSADPIISYFALEAGDTFSYLEPFTNLLENGEYYFINHLDEKIYAGRLPFYGILYFLLYPFLSYSHIGAIYIISQLLLESLGLLAIFRILKFQFPKSKFSTYLLLIIGIVCMYQTLYSARLLPESFGISLFALILHQIYFYRKRPTTYSVITIGILYLLIVGLKPYFGIMIIPISYEIWKKRKSINLYFQFVIFVLPFLLFCSIWTIRNQAKYESIIPLTQKYSGYGISRPYLALRNYLGTLGENQEPWEPKAQGSFFFKRKTFYTINDLYTDNYITKDSLLEVKEYFTNEIKVTPDSVITAKLNRYTAHYIDSHPFYRISSFLSLSKKFLFHSGSYNLHIQKSGSCYKPWHWLFKIGQSLIYYLLFIGFTFGVFLWRDWIIYFYPFFLIVFFCGILQFVELRYFYQAFPCLLLGLGAFFCTIEKKLIKP